MEPRTHEELIPTRQSLLERLREWDNHASWQEFFDIYWKLIYRTALNTGLRPVEAEEVVQETVISVAKQMPGFRYRSSEEGGSFKKWLLNLTSWRIKDQLRKRRPESSLDAVLPGHDPGRTDGGEWMDPESNALEQKWDAEWEGTLLEAAMLRVKRRINPKHYQIFHLYAMKGWSALRVSKNLSVSLTEVYTVKHRVSNQIKAALEQLREHPFE